MMRRIARGQSVVNAGDRSDYVYFVLTGSLKVIVSDEENTEEEPSTINFLDVLSQSVKKNTKTAPSAKAGRQVILPRKGGRAEPGVLRGGSIIRSERDDGIRTLTAKSEFQADQGACRKAGCAA